MMRLINILAVVFALALTCQANEDPVAVFLAHVDQDVEMLWNQLETDADHVFLRDDLQSFIINTDADGNGHSTEAEFLHYWVTHDPTLREMGHGMFLEFDTNKDGLMDGGDLDAIYSRIDMDGSGQVDKAEFSTYFKQLLTVVYLIHLQTVPVPVV